MAVAALFLALCAVTDCVRQKIDRRVLTAGYCVGAILLIWRLSQGSETWLSVLAALSPGICFFLLSCLTEGKVGRGDGDMVLILGLFLGWQKCLAILTGACLLTAVYAGAGLVAGRLKKDSGIPFAPFLLVGTLLTWIMISAQSA